MFQLDGIRGNYSKQLIHQKEREAKAEKEKKKTNIPHQKNSKKCYAQPSCAMNQEIRAALFNKTGHSQLLI